MNEQPNPHVFQWLITYSPQQGIRIDGPRDPRLILDMLGKAIVVMAQHVVPKEEPKVVPVTPGDLAALKHELSRRKDD